MRDALSNAGYTVTVTGDPEQVGRLVEEERPHLVLLDLMLPGMDGIELMESVPELADLPVIFLSAYGRDQVIARALEAGAEDYVVKPFSPTELVARVQTVLRRRAASELSEPPEPYRRGELTIDYAGRRVSLAGSAVLLTNIEYRLLFELSVNAGRVLTHDQLLQRVWGPEHSGQPGAVRTFVKNLRRKLGDDADTPNYIFTEPQVGYRMPRGEGVIMLTADTLLAYAVGPPSLGKRKPTSTLSGRGMLLKPGPADQRPKNHKTRHFQVPAVTAHRSGQQPWSWESAQPWRLEAWA